MRIVLIYVHSDAFNYDYVLEERSKRGWTQIIGFPPLGIMALSAVLKREGHECIMFDQRNPETPNNVIVDEIRRLQPDLVGLSCLSAPIYPKTKILARQIRAANAKVKIAFGGVFATLNALRIMKDCPEVDYVCSGDGEQLILDLLENLEDPSNVRSVIWTDEGGTIRQSLPRPLERDLDQWPFPDRESLPLDFLESLFHHPAVVSMDRYTTMQTSRGCPWKCIFCDIPTLNEGKWRSRSPEHVVAEMRHLQEHGYGSVYFTDDHFLLAPKRIEQICQPLIDGGNSINGSTLKWSCEGRVDSVCTELFPMMAESQCRSIFFGIESGSQKTLDRLVKDQNLVQIDTAVNKAKKAGIEIVHGFFIYGSPDETEEDMRQSFRFAAKLRIDTYSFNDLCVYRGTPLWNEYIQRGLVDEEKDWDAYCACTSIDPTVLPREKINKVLAEEKWRMMAYKILRYPLQSLRALRRFARHMPNKDLIQLMARPFLRIIAGVTRAEPVSPADEYREVKSAAADLPQVSDDQPQAVIADSQVDKERLSA